MTPATYDHGRGSPGSTEALARGLGWFSIGLGLAELMAPRTLTRALGMQGHEGLVQGLGARELATGVAILSSQHPVPWIWGRVGGDVLDMATLATGLEEDNPKRGNVGLALAAVAGVTALDVLCATALSRAPNGRAKSSLARAAPGHVPRHDYSGRTGFPHGVSAARGAARDFETPKDFRIPEPMRPYTSAAYQPLPAGAMWSSPMRGR